MGSHAFELQVRGSKASSISCILEYSHAVKYRIEGAKLSAVGVVLDFRKAMTHSRIQTTASVYQSYLVTFDALSDPHPCLIPNLHVRPPPHRHPSVTHHTPQSS